MKLTVLNVAYPFAPVGVDAIGGAEQVLTSIDRALVRAGHRSIVVACEQSHTAGELVASVPCHEVLSGDLCAFARAEHRRAIDQALDRWPVDVVHMHGVDFHEYLPETDLPVIVTLHLPASYYPVQVLRDLPRNVRLHCVSQSQARAFPADLNLLPVIQNSVDVDAFAARHAKRRLAVALGRICPEKGLHLAVEAAKRADTPLLLAGEVFGHASHGEYWRNELLPRLDRRRRWIGSADFSRKRRLLSAAMCAVVPSLVAETGSLVAMEALACGTPVVAFPNGALADVVEHGRTGFLVQNVDEMAQAIRDARFLDPEECRHAARTRFDKADSIARYLELYDDLGAIQRAERDILHVA